MIVKDLIIIGAGPGGYETAVKAARRGLDTLIVEAEELGGTCLNVGCIPTKCLCRNAEILINLRDSEKWGVNDLSYRFDIRRAMARKDEVVATLRSGIETLLSAPGITRVKGRARFVEAHTVEVDDARNAEGIPLTDNRFSASRIIIATGSETKIPSFPGVRLPGVLTSTEMLRLSFVPERLCVIGGGVIGMEFASIFGAFGSKVTVLEYCKEMLPNFDVDLVKRMKPSFKRAGIELVNQAAVESITQEENLIVTYECKGEKKRQEADVVLLAVGRKARVEGLGLEHAGIRFTPLGIAVNEHMMTNVEGVYAVGDVNGLCQLAHAATFQGEKALCHMLNEPSDIRLDIMPAAIFTHPEAAGVGMTEAECKTKGIETKSYKGFFRTNGKALAMGEPEGMVKIVTDAEGHILGGHLFGAHAADIIQELVPMIARRATIKELSSTIHAHPTLGEVLLDATS